MRDNWQSTDAGKQGGGGGFVEGSPDLYGPSSEKEGMWRVESAVLPVGKAVDVKAKAG